MPVGKYYCDYCEKEFQDTPAARKRHLNGVHHHRAKSLWYSTTTTTTAATHDHANRILPDQFLGKGFCNRFVRTGSCSYGDSCKYIHPRQSFPTLNPQDVPGNVVKGNIGISLGSLPPSLQPPPEGGYPHLPFIDWG